MARFLKESEMTPAVAAWLGGHGLVVKREFSLPWGVCDLVGAGLNASRVEKRLELRQRRVIGPLSRVSLLLVLPDVESGRGVTLRKLSEMFEGFFSADEISSELAVLEANRFVYRRGTSSFQKVNGWMPLHERMIAIELKRERVDEALCQARRNKEFTWESYVGLPASVAERVCNTKKRYDFEAAGVGLLGVDSGAVEVLLEPRRSRDRRRARSCCRRQAAPNRGQRCPRKNSGTKHPGEG
jgi:hypothetical protein